MKTCTKCKTTRPLYEYYKDRGYLRSECKPCSKAQSLTWQRKNVEKRNKTRRKTRIRNGGMRSYSRIKLTDRERWLIKKIKYPERIRAKDVVGYAIRAGKLKRKPCDVCGTTKVDGHHEDYTKPLEVIWLCRKHHNLLHSRKLRAMFKEGE